MKMCRTLYNYASHNAENDKNAEIYKFIAEIYENKHKFIQFCKSECINL